MRNLKRALSLTLASVMLLGMMVLGTSAASYPDVTDEHNVEAIEVLQAVGVMSGSNSGNFNPDSKVTRIEMAIVMANLLNLNVDYFQGQNQFSDVPDWASGYVNACAASGIVTGVGGGRFGTGNVTATQAALMMMKALGYFQYNSDFGNDWARATALQAAKINLFDGIEARDNTQLTRNQVAKLALNALEADMVDPEDNTLTINTGENAGNISITGGQVVYHVRTNGAPFANTINTATSSSGSSIDGRSGPIVQLGEQLYMGDLKLNDSDTDDFGRPARTWTYKNAAVGTYGKKADMVASYTGKVSKNDIYNALSGTVRSDVEAATTSNNARMRVWVDGAETKVYLTSALAADGSNANRFASYYTRNSNDPIYTISDGDPDNQKSTRKGTVTEVYVTEHRSTNNNSVTTWREVDIVIANTFVYQATSDYLSGSNEVRMAPVGDTITTLANQRMTVNSDQLTLKGEDFAIENIKNEDYLLITLSTKGASNNYVVKSVDVARKVEGNVDSWAENDSVTIDGTKYSYSATTRRSGDASVQATQYTVGQPAIVVLDKYDNIIAVDEAVASSNFVFVKAFGKTSGVSTNVQASAYFTDGTGVTIDVESVAGVKSASSILGGDAVVTKTQNTWYTYSVNSNGKYVLYNVPGRYTPGTATATTGKLVNNGKVDFLPTAPTALANNNTILVAIDKDGDVGAYTGTTQIPDVTMTGTAKTVYYLTDSDGYVDYAFVDLEGSGASLVDGGEDSAFMYVLRYGKRNNSANATTTYTYSAIDDETGAVEDKVFDTAYFGVDNNPYALYYKARTNSDGEITNLTSIASDASASNKYFNHYLSNVELKQSGTSLTFNADEGSVSYTATSNSKIVLIALKGSYAQSEANKKENHEIRFNINPATLKSVLMPTSGSRFHATLAGSTVSSTSKVIDTLYITVAPTAFTYEMPDDATVDQDALNEAINEANGKTVVIPDSATISGNLEIPANGKVVIEASTAGVDITAKAGSEVTAPEAKDVTTEAGAAVTIAGAVSGAVNAGANSTVSTGAVTSNVTAGAGSEVNVEGTVGGDVTAAANSEVNITGTVTGTVTAEEGATVIVGGTQVTRAADPESNVGGKVTAKKNSTVEIHGAITDGGADIAEGATVKVSGNITGTVALQHATATLVLNTGVTAMPTLSGNGILDCKVDLTDGWSETESNAFNTLLTSNAASAEAADATAVAVDTSSVVAFKGTGKIPGFGAKSVDGYVGAGNTGKLAKLVLTGVEAGDKISAKITRGGVETEMKFGLNNDTQYVLKDGDLKDSSKVQFEVLVSSADTKIVYTVMDKDAAEGGDAQGTFTFTFGTSAS